MKKILLYGVVGLVLFGASAGVSWYINRKPAEDAGGANHGAGHGHGHGEKAKHGGEKIHPVAHTPASEKKGSDSGHHGKAEPHVEPPKVAARAPFIPSAESTVTLVDGIERRKQELQDREERINARQRALEIALKDIRGERTAMDALRKQAQDEIRAAENHIKMLESRHHDLNSAKQKVENEKKDLQGVLKTVEDAEFKNLQGIASTLDNMGAEDAAKIIGVLLADPKQEQSAARIVSMLKERQGARLLASLPEASSAKLLDMMKSLKKPNPLPKKP
jgi:DNA repair exonuclease SbcCD ATPase subunit